MYEKQLFTGMIYGITVQEFHEPTAARLPEVDPDELNHVRLEQVDVPPRSALDLK